MLRSDISRPLEVAPRLDTGVMFLDLFPGIRPSTLSHLLSTPGIKGVVMRTYGAGNAPTNRIFTDTVKRAIEKGLEIVNVTQCVNGGVSKRYAAGDKLAEAGVISGRDLTAEAAITKLMHLLGCGFTGEELRREFERSIAGELT